MKIDMPYVKQVSDMPFCGVACLSMIYEKKYHEDAIQHVLWNLVKKQSPNGREYCGTSELCLNAINMGYVTMTIKARDPISMFEFCLSNQIDLIILHHQKIGDTLAHFSVLTGIENDTIFVNNPDGSSNTNGQTLGYERNELFDLMLGSGETDEIPSGSRIVIAVSERTNTLLLAGDFPYFNCPHEDCNEIITIIKSLADKIQTHESLYIVCPHCDKDIVFQPLAPPPPPVSGAG